MAPRQNVGFVKVPYDNDNTCNDELNNVFRQTQLLTV